MSEKHNEKLGLVATESPLSDKEMADLHRKKVQELVEKYDTYYSKYAFANGRNDDFKFINPYSFLPFSENEPERWTFPQDGDEEGSDDNKKLVREYKDTYTGFLKCNLEVQDWSGLFIPNTTKRFEGNNKHQSEEFYSYDDLSECMDERPRYTKLPESEPVEPRIPGSEIRGMVRGVYEFLSNSCYSQISEELPLKRTNIAKKPYLLVRDDTNTGWKLKKGPSIIKLGLPEDTGGILLDGKDFTPSADDSYKKYCIDGSAKKHISKHQNKKTGETRCVDCGYYHARISTYHPENPPTDGKVYFLHVSNEYEEKKKGQKTGIRKNHYRLFEKNSGSCIDDITYMDSREDSENPIVGLKKVVASYCADPASAYTKYAELLENPTVDTQLLVYADSNRKNLSPACLTKEYHRGSVSEKLGNHKPCNEEDGFCPACRLFGTVAGKTQIGSRVRFANSEPAADGSSFAKPTPLPILSSPRITATEFYFGGNSYTRRAMGRKFYWHHALNLELYENRDNDQQDRTVRYMNYGSFDFKVFFEDLSDEELSDLIFALGGFGKGRMQKLGRGKPVGLGSVKVRVKKARIRTYSLDDGVFQLGLKELSPDWDDHVVAKDSDAKIKRRAMLVHIAQRVDTKTGLMVHYPASKNPIKNKIGEDNPIYDWFKKNRNNGQIGSDQASQRYRSDGDWIPKASRR